MKNFLNGLLFAFVFAFLFSSPVAAQTPAVVVDITPSTQQVPLGQLFEQTVRVSNNSDQPLILEIVTLTVDDPGIVIHSFQFNGITGGGPEPVGIASTQAFSVTMEPNDHLPIILDPAATAEYLVIGQVATDRTFLRHQVCAHTSTLEGEPQPTQCAESITNPVPTGEAPTEQPEQMSNILFLPSIVR